MMMMIMDDNDDDNGGYDDDNHRFQIIIAVVNEALREVIQFQEPGFGDYHMMMISAKMDPTYDTYDNNQKRLVYIKNYQDQ